MLSILLFCNTSTGTDIQNCHWQEYENGASMIVVNSGLKTRRLNMNFLYFEAVIANIAGLT